MTDIDTGKECTQPADLLYVVGSTQVPTCDHCAGYLPPMSFCFQNLSEWKGSKS